MKREILLQDNGDKAVIRGGSETFDHISEKGTYQKFFRRAKKELWKIATTESIGSSTRIEGGTLTDKEIEELLNDIKITKLKTRD